MKLLNPVLLGLACLVYGETYFAEDFGTDAWADRWVHSKANPEMGKFEIDREARALKTTQDNKLYAISAPFDKPFDNTEKDLIIQYTLKHGQNIECGGGYLKLLVSSDNLDQFNGDTPYNIMFGPDICGDEKHTHAILSYQGKSFLVNKKMNAKSDKFTHLYTFILKPDMTYQFLIDNEISQKGNVADDWDVFGQRTIKDPRSVKPANWVDDKYIDEVRPPGTENEPQMIDDPNATVPADWDTEVNGEFVPPQIPNPRYTPPKKVLNPAYDGDFYPAQIPNPEYRIDPELYRYVTKAVGIDIWQVKSGSLFDNIIITDSIEEAAAHAKKHFAPIKEADNKVETAEEARLRVEEKEIAKRTLEESEKRRKAMNGGQKKTTGNVVTDEPVVVNNEESDDEQEMDNIDRNDQGEDDNRDNESAKDNTAVIEEPRKPFGRRGLADDMAYPDFHQEHVKSRDEL